MVKVSPGETCVFFPGLFIWCPFRARNAANMLEFFLQIHLLRDGQAVCHLVRLNLNK